MIEVHGVTLRVDLDDYPSLHIFAYRNLYEVDSVKLCKRLIKPGMVCIDVGSNVGLFSMLFLKLVGKQGKVFSFEVNKNVFRHLEHNTRDHPNSVLHQFFVSNKCTKINYSSTNEENGEYDAITTCRLDDLINEKVDFIKIDIDGLDLYALQGAEGIIKKYKPQILIEISEDSYRTHGIHFLEIIEYLRGFDYEVYEANEEQKLFTKTVLPRNAVSNLFFK